MILMKRALIIGFCLVTITLLSCSKDDDFTDPDNLSGTEWKSFDVGFAEVEYYLFKFTSNIKFEFWIKEKGEDINKVLSGIYSLSGKTISFDFGDGIIISGVIEGSIMNFAYDGCVSVFTKE